MSMKKKKLSPKQLLFCKEYLVDLNATQAAIRAGYSEKTAYSHGQRLLKHVEAQKEIQKLMDERADKVELTAEKVLREIAKIAFANMFDYISIQSDGTAIVDLSKLTRDQASAIQEIIVDEYTQRSGDDGDRVKKIKFKLADKKGSLELLGKHLKLFTDNLSINADVKQEVSFDDVPDEELILAAEAIIRKTKQNSKDQ